MYGLNAARVGFSDLFNYWYVLATYWAMGWWFINDSRNHDIKWVSKYMDMGMLLYATWIFLIPYYLFKTREWKRALLMIGVILGIFFGAYIMGVVIYSIASIF